MLAWFCGAALVHSASAVEVRGWSMCPDSPMPPEDAEGCLQARVPGTVFTTLLESGAYNFTDPYYALNLQDVPDISQVGSEHYTRWFLTELTDSSARRGGRSWLHFHGINFRSDVFINGVHVGKTAGMFQRFTFDVTKALSSGPALLQVRVRPPDFPGSNVSGQGGDHQLARNGPVMQMAAGWDWIQATPDRNTGIWDRVELLHTGPAQLRDPHVRTRFTAHGRRAAEKAAVASAEMVLSVAIDVVAAAPCEGNVRFVVKDDMGHRVAAGNASVQLRTGMQAVTFDDVIVSSAQLWWPHAFGAPYLHSLDVVLELADGSSSDSLQRKIGFREIRKTTDLNLGGPVLFVNEQRLFLRGGNWIGTDQFLRYVGDSDRYRQEVLNHRAMGLDLLRVWGGGITERSGFYDACDELGILVWQEFWMSGDNNGRWAGDFDWPEDHGLYIAAVEDVVKMLRSRASLAIWCGGNELDPTDVNPPADITHVMHRLLDGDERPFFVSSMTNETHYDPEIHAAPRDGPYHMLELEQFYGRNPGLHLENVSVVLNPELGSSCFPVYSSLARFLSPEALASLPRGDEPEGNLTGEWEWHNWLGYKTDDVGTNLITAMGGAPSNASEFAFRAQIVQFMQNRALFEGFSQFMWTYYSGVLMWKTQSPWPSLRGFLYDWYLHPTGGFYGVLEANRPGHAQLDLLTRRVYVVNRAPSASLHGRLEAACYGLDGRPVGSVHGFDMAVAPNQVQKFAELPRHNKLTILRLNVRVGNGSDRVSEYLLPAGQQPAAALHGLARYRSLDAQARLEVGRQDRGRIMLTVAAAGSMPLLFVVATPVDAADQPVLPHRCDLGYFHVLPGEKREVSCWAKGPVSSIRLEGWNIRTTSATVLPERPVVAV